ncbi:MAG TPA: ComEC/Rec2 family competence protein [Candidatus Paceibacterota bacterium]
MKTRLPRPALALLIAGLLLANAAVYLFAFKSPVRELRVSFLDVGQGDSILIESPSGIDLLIDAGKDRSAVRVLPQVLGPLDRTIDIIVATHPDADHIGGLPEVLARYRAETVLLSGRTGDSSYAEHLAAAIRDEEAQVAFAREGMRLHLGKGVYADVLHPEANVATLRDTNDASVTLRLVYGDTAFLLSGDAPVWVEERLVREYGAKLTSDVLKAGHHGSRTSTSETFLAAVDPEQVVISAGKDNPYGHPHPEVLEHIRAQGAEALSTIEEGTITFVSDGKGIWVR